MTTLRIEVGRYSGTTVQDVIKGLRQAGCMKHIEIYPESYAFLPIEELRSALIGDGFCVDDVTEPPPPPLPWWRYVRAWPRRVYYWLRRVFLRESIEDQIVRSMLDIYDQDGTLLHAISTRESPFMRKVQERDGERFTVSGRGTAHRDDPPPWHPICWKCGARFPNGPGEYSARCPACGEPWDGSEASDPPLAS